MQKEYTKEFLLGLYRRMLRIRKFEEQAKECFTKGMLAGNIHLAIGQEATEVGACAALKDTDYITGTHRGHGQCIAKGARTDRMMAELFGKKTGYCGGKGGSMHIVDATLGILGANGIVGAGLPIATGAAYASKVWKDGAVTLCFFGDAAANQGTFHESINMAAAWKLPAIYLCENNKYGVSTDIARVTNNEHISERAAAYNIPGVTVDGNDVLAVYEAVREAVERARNGEGPTLVECVTYRHEGHYCGDQAGYRPAEYMQKALANEAIPNFRKYMLGHGVPEAEVTAVEEEVTQEIAQAYAFADASEYPDPAEVTRNVYTMDNERSVLR
ncbi:MAG TPA: thiamine pyrophosphate-dependent dehydrogenase E1 component subunit alpha [Candidatus Limnocylindria bacterium]|nr:thiamine pyrophosphate-dependent dehydrogenase E1 component subunit alpha [Candidatus Limnocylindria bacterium]